MKWVENSVLGTGQRALKFLDEQAAVLGELSSGLNRLELEAAVTALQAAGAAQEEAKTEMTSLTKEKKARRDELLDDHLRPIAAIASKITKEGTPAAPTMQDARAPRSRVSDATMVQKGLALAAAAEQYPAEYAGQQMPADFARQARNATRAVQHALDVRELSRSSHVRATKSASEQTATVRDRIRVMNGLVSAFLLRIHRPDLLEAWKQARRYPEKPGKKRKRKKKTDPSSPTDRGATQ
jgi:hypothetical protein